MAGVICKLAGVTLFFYLKKNYIVTSKITKMCCLIACLHKSFANYHGIKNFNTQNIKKKKTKKKNSGCGELNGAPPS